MRYPRISLLSFVLLSISCSNPEPLTPTTSSFHSVLFSDWSGNFYIFTAPDTPHQAMQQFQLNQFQKAGKILREELNDDPRPETWILTGEMLARRSEAAFAITELTAKFIVNDYAFLQEEKTDTALNIREVVDACQYLNIPGPDREENSSPGSGRERESLFHPEKYCAQYQSCPALLQYINAVMRILQSAPDIDIAAYLKLTFPKMDFHALQAPCSRVPVIYFKAVSDSRAAAACFSRALKLSSGLSDTLRDRLHYKIGLCQALADQPDSALTFLGKSTYPPAQVVSAIISSAETVQYATTPEGMRIGLFLAKIRRIPQYKSLLSAYSSRLKQLCADKPSRFDIPMDAQLWFWQRQRFLAVIADGLSPEAFRRLQNEDNQDSLDTDIRFSEIPFLTRIMDNLLHRSTRLYPRLQVLLMKTEKQCPEIRTAEIHFKSLYTLKVKGIGGIDSIK